MGHHKSNKAVEGDPDTGHGGGLPLRPAEAEYTERTESERLAVGLAPNPGATPADVDPQAAYDEGLTAIDEQVMAGRLRADRDAPRRDREPFPPTRYSG